MKRLIVALGCALAVSLGATAAEAKLKVFACFAEWASLAKAIGGDRVDVSLVTSPLENVDNVQPTPGLIAAMRDADLAVCTGVHLEDEWLPQVEEKAANPKVAVGQPGMFFAGDYIQIAGGEHINGEGNPHFQRDPRNIMRVGAQLTKRMVTLDPDGQATYTENFKAFAGKLKDEIAALEKKAAPLRGVRVIAQHDDALYLANWLGMVVVTTLEPEEGVQPGPDFLTKAVQLATANGAKFVMYSAYADPNSSKYVAKQAGIPVVKMPFTVGGTPESKDLFSFYQDEVDRLLDGLKGNDRT
jgi:zinc/manganese transport system substrate-binding protein